jgi:hypothetical protein
LFRDPLPQLLELAIHGSGIALDSDISISELTTSL